MPTKHPGPPSGKTQPPVATFASGRKPWKKKSPVEVVLDQGEKLRKEIADTEEDLKQKRKQLQKFDEIRKLLEGS